MKPTIHVDLLGGLRVFADGAVLLENAPKVNKPWQVFCYLLMHRDAPTPAAKLLEALWMDETLADPNNVLKNTIYALRREFKTAAGDSGNPILFDNGGYICNPEIDFVVDVEEFEAGVNRGKDLHGLEKTRMQQQAAALYKGNLLPQLSDEVWVLTREIYYKKLYSECMGELCNALYEQKRFTELLVQARAAARVDPLEEAYLLHMLRAMFSLGMYRAIVPVYQQFSRVFTEELGTSLTGEVRRIYASASERINPIEQDIMIIKDDLREVNYDNSPPDGPLYCSYEVFKYLYQMVARTAERTGSKILILLLSLQEQDGGAPSAAKLNVAMDGVKDRLLGGMLRKSDTVARYSKSQYIIMLPSDQPNGAEPVIQRLQHHCRPVLEPLDLRMVFATATLEHST